MRTDSEGYSALLRRGVVPRDQSGPGGDDDGMGVSVNHLAGPFLSRAPEWSHVVDEM
jgi:hypothetical protein